MIYKMLFLVVAAAATSISSAQTVTEVISSRGLETLTEALIATGLADTLNQSGQFTVFAPSDLSFARIPIGQLEDLLSDTEAMRRILMYHVVQGVMTSQLMVSGMMADTMLTNHSIFITLEDGRVMVNNEARVSEANLMADNGVVHVIDTLLMPKEQPMPIPNLEGLAGLVMDRMAENDGGENSNITAGLMEVASENRLSSVVFLAQMAGLYGTLNEQGPFTILAPNDGAAFTNLPAPVADSFMTDPEMLATLLKGHVVPGIVMSSDISDGFTATSLAGTNVTFGVSEEGAISVNGRTSEVLLPDIVADNGVIHVIDSILVPQQFLEKPGHIIEVLESKKFTTLLKLLEAANLTESLANGEALTLFAPTDEAFESSLTPEQTSALLENPSELSNILLYHVAHGVLHSSNFSDNLLQPTLLGGESKLRINLFVEKEGHAVLTVDGVRIVKLNIPASNGVIHVVENILTEPKGTIADIIEADEDLTILSKAVKGMGIEDFLSGEGPFTVLAPTDEAFGAVPPAALMRLLSHRDSLRQIVMNHLLPAALYREGLSWNVFLSAGNGMISFGTDLNGQPIVGSRVSITTFSGQEIKARNGVLHKINAVLLN